MHARRRTPLRTWLAALTAAALAVSGAVVVDVASAPPARAAYPDSFNPFSMNGGFTVYAREDALLQNQETEGSIAVGGTSTVQGSSGQYTIIHVAAGTGDYDLPTVDGDPTRYLVGSHSADSAGILAVTSAGTSNSALWGDVKMVERDGPWEGFARADWIRLNEDRTDPNLTPLIDATHQTYPTSATPPTGSAGNSSIYTANTGATAVADYVEAAREASYEAAQDCLDGLVTDDAGYPVGVAEDVGSRVVLEPLSADRPNIVDYADIAGTALIQYSPGPTPGVTNPLIIRVPAGTTEVIGTRSDPQGAYSPYIFWDLSELTGDVTVTAAEGRMDGSVYAPEAAVTINAAPLDGQVLGRDVTLLGGEVHSFLFAGEITCDADHGTFAVRKELDGIDASDLPDGTTFTVNFTATEPDGVITTGTLEVPVDGSPVEAGVEFPVGTVVEFEEIEPESVPGYEWGTPSIDPDPLTIGAGSAQVVVTNTATEQTGTFSITKEIVDLTGGAPATPPGATVPVEWAALHSGEVIASGTLDVPLDGTPIAVGQDFPVGTVIVLTENLESITPPDGYRWVDASFDPGRVFVIDDTASVAVELTNTVVPDESDRVITIVKSAEGAASDPAFGYTATYNIDPPGTRSDPIPLPVGDAVTILDLETGADTLDLAEQVPTLNGEPTDPGDWEEPVFSVTINGVTTEYPSGGFDEIVEIALGTEGDVAIEVANSLVEGTFELSKEFENISGDHIGGLEFTVVWTAVTPTGEQYRGVMRLPADGTPTRPTTIGGDPRTFPYGTVVSFTELAAPTRAHLEWASATFDPEQVVIGAGGESVVASTLTNSADLTTGTFQVAKALDGIAPSELLIDSFTVDYVAWLPTGDPVAGTFELPADGTPAGPTDAAGEPLEFPIGTSVRLLEEAPDASALPPGFQWSGTVWTPGDSVIIGTGETPVLQVTNSVEEFTRYAGTKVVDGDGASMLPDGTTFPVEWWWDHVPQGGITVEPDVTIVSPWFPVGSIIELREGKLPDIPNVDWGTPSWTINGETLGPQADGRVVLPATTVRDQGVVELQLTNYADAEELPATGGGGVSPALPIGALAMILAGAGLLVARRRLQA